MRLPRLGGYPWCCRRRRDVAPPGYKIDQSAEHLLSTTLMSWSRRKRGPTLRSACSALHQRAPCGSLEPRHDFGAQDRGTGRQEPRSAARRCRTPDARRGLCRSHFPPGGGEGGAQTTAGSLLLPHDGRLVLGGVPAPRRARPRGAGAGAAGARNHCGRCGGSAPIRRPPRSPWNSSRWPTTARR